MPAMMDRMKHLALSPSCRQSRFSRASSTADAMGTRAPAANSQNRAEYLQHTTRNHVGQCFTPGTGAHCGSQRFQSFLADGPERLLTMQWRSLGRKASYFLAIR